MELGISSPDDALVITDPVTQEERSVRVKVEEVAQAVLTSGQLCQSLLWDSHCRRETMVCTTMLVHQLTWGRFVNTHSGKGRNIPCDLHNEHVNKQFKEIVENMGSNFTQQASTTAARSVTTLTSLAEKFDRATGIHPESSAHTRRSDRDDVIKIVDVIRRNQVLTAMTNREHANFKGFSGNPLNSLDREKMESWIKTKVSQHNKLLSTTEDSDTEDRLSDEEFIDE